MRILDRYILKSFLVPFLYCFLGFIAIWLAFDLAQRTDDLINAKLSPSVLLFYYGTQIPEFVIIVLPAALLLALLYSLSRMSRSNEIISMLSAGVSIYRLIVPLVMMGVLVAGVCFAMNYKLAPHADIFKKLELLGREHDFERLSAEVEKDRQKMEDAKTKLDDIGKRGNVIDPNPEDGKSAVQNTTPEYNQAKADYLSVEKTFSSYRQFQDTFYVADALLFRNRADSRTWIVQLRTTVLSPYQRASHPDLTAIKSVEITQQDKSGNLVRNYDAGRVAYDPADSTWTFYNGKTVEYHADGSAPTEDYWDTLKMSNWSETPWRVFSTDLDAANLSLPELEDYLRFNSDFPESQLAAYRTYFQRQGALPVSCIVVVFVAAPLGIVYSRRGVLAGVAAAIFIFFGIMFFDKLLLALGKHGSIPPLFAAWGTDIIFGVVGLALLYVRATNLDPAKLNPKTFLHLFKQS